MTASASELTRLLKAWQDGDADAAEELFSFVYEDLRAIAHKEHGSWIRRGDRQTTELVHEMYLKLDRSAKLDFNDRRHFYLVASRAVRQLLIDYSRRWLAERRGGGAKRITLDDEEVSVEADREAAEMVDLDRALTKLETVDQRLARVVQLHFFGGLTYDEVARTLDIGRATVSRDWEIAKAWLSRELRAS